MFIETGQGADYSKQACFAEAEQSMDYKVSYSSGKFLFTHSPELNCPFSPPAATLFWGLH